MCGCAIVNLVGPRASSRTWRASHGGGTALRREDEGELVEAARRGDRDAAEALLERHELLVFRTCRRLLPAGEDVEAAVQETLLRALKNLGRFTGERELRRLGGRHRRQPLP